MPKPTKSSTATKANSVEELKAKAEELARQAEEAQGSLREVEHRERKRQTPEQVKANKERQEFYQKHKKVIDRELEACTSHLRKFDDVEVPLEIIRRLRDYYLDWFGRRRTHEDGSPRNDDDSHLTWTKLRGSMHHPRHRGRSSSQDWVDVATSERWPIALAAIRSSTLSPSGLSATPRRTRF